MSCVSFVLLERALLAFGLLMTGRVVRFSNAALHTPTHCDRAAQFLAIPQLAGLNQTLHSLSFKCEEATY